MTGLIIVASVAVAVFAALTKGEELARKVVFAWQSR